jgi:hypothetical protein
MTARSASGGILLLFALELDLDEAGPAESV